MTAASRTDRTSVLVIGFGNPGRLDDGLGPAFAVRLAEAGINGVTVDSDYQLNIENAADIAEHDVVVFVDASVNSPEPFSFYRLEPAEDTSFSTHSVSPRAVLHLAHQCFEARTRGYVLEIRGYEFDDFGEELSERSRKNLESALEFATELFEEKRFEAAAACACAAVSETGA